nr:hypothetical protein [uncultured Holophaga sp.]
MYKLASVIRRLRKAEEDIKAALQAMHRGPGGMPRDVVYGGLGIGKDLYNKWLNQDELTRLPPLMMFVAIGGITDDPGPLEALARHYGTGYRVVPADGSGHPQERGAVEDGVKILADHAGVAGALSARLAKDLDDGVSPEEAYADLELAEINMVTAQRTYQRLRRIAASGGLL